MTDEGQRELDELVRRRKDINTEISRVQDVLSALEAFEAPAPAAHSNGGSKKDGGPKAGAGVGSPRSGGNRSGGAPPD